MRLNNYLNENIDDFLVFTNKLKKDCSVSFNLYKKGMFLYRGILKGGNLEQYGIKIPRKDRKPYSTNIRHHYQLDDLFNDKFGWRARSEGLFVTGEPSFAGAYGRLFIVFPVNGFKFVWSNKVRDLYDITRIKDEDDFEDIVDGYTSTNLEQAIRSGNEIMVKCKKYYYIDEYYPNIDYLLK